MALVLADRVKETTTTTGTGTVTLAGAVSGFQSFAVIGNANTTYYTIAGQGTSEWEVGLGTYTLSGTTLSRDTVLSNSLGTTAKINFSAGTKDVFVTYPAGKAIYDGGAFNGTVGATTPAAGAFTTLSATGVTTVQAGSVTTPAITTSGDTNTGIFFPAVDTIAFAEGGTEVGRFDSSSNFKFNSGYGSAATAYGCRAWVNFDGTTASNLAGTYSQTATTVTVTATAHGLITGNVVYLDFTTGTAVDGSYTVTVTGVNTFTVTQAARSTSGNVTLVRNTIRGSGNISSVADNNVGDYTVNFTTAMPDVNYAAIATSTQRGGAGTPNSNISIGFGSTATTRTEGFYSTSALQVFCQTSAGASQDLPTIAIAVFR